MRKVIGQEDKEGSMCVPDRGTAVLHKAWKFERKEASVTGTSKLEKRHKMKRGTRCRGQIGISCSKEFGCQLYVKGAPIKEL